MAFIPRDERPEEVKKKGRDAYSVKAVASETWKKLAFSASTDADDAVLAGVGSRDRWRHEEDWCRRLCD